MAVKLLLICVSKRVYSVCAWPCVTLCATSKVNGGPQFLVSLFWGSQAEKFGNHCPRGWRSGDCGGHWSPFIIYKALCATFYCMKSAL